MFNKKGTAIKLYFILLLLLLPANLSTPSLNNMTEETPFSNNTNSKFNPTVVNDIENTLDNSTVQKHSQIKNPSATPISYALSSDTTSNTLYEGERVKVNYESKNNTVKSLDYSYKKNFQFLLKWGTEGSADGELDYPRGIDVDGEGYLYVTDYLNNRVQKYDSSGGFILNWGIFGTGDGQFNNPSGIAIDENGDVYVTDLGNSRVQKFNSTGSFILKWTTTYPTPFGITIDNSGDVYVVESSSSKIVKYSNTGSFILEWGSSGTGDGEFEAPFGITSDVDNNIYVTDGGATAGNSVQKFNSTGSFILKWGGGAIGTGDGEFNTPTEIAIDTNGDVYVADQGNDRIQKFNNTGSFILKWGVFGTGDGEFNNVWGLAVDSSGNVYTSEITNDRIQKFGFTIMPITTLGLLPIAIDDNYLLIDNSKTNTLIYEDVYIGFTYYDLVTPSQVGMAFSWETKKSAIFTSIMDTQILTSISNLAVYSSDELKIDIVFSYSNDSGFVATISMFDTGLNQYISTTVTSTLDYFNFDNSIIKIDYIWAESTEYTADIKSQYEYTPNFESIIHTFYVELFDYRIPLKIYSPLNWTFSSINPSAAVTYNAIDYAYQISNTLPTTYEFTFTSTSNYSIAIKDQRDLLSSPSFEGNFNDWEESAINPFDTLERQTQIVSDGIFALNLTDSNSYGELLFKPSGENFTDGTYYISFYYYIVDLPEEDNYFVYQENGTLINNSLPTILNRWHKLFFEFELSDGINNLVKLSFQSTSGSYQILIDNVFIGKNSQIVITKNTSEYIFSSYYIRWDGYGNPIYPFLDVNLRLNDVFGTEIFNTTITTDQYGYAEYTYSGTFLEQNYIVNWTSIESGWNNSQIESILPQLASKTTVRDYDFSEESIEDMTNFDDDTTSFEDNLLNITSTGNDYWGFYKTYTETDKDYSVSARMQRTGGTNSFMGIIFYDIPEASLSDDVFLIRPATFDTILRVDGIETNPVLQTFSDTWYNIRADITENQVKIYVNNILIATRINTNSRTNPSIGLYGFDSNVQVDFIRFSMLSNPDLIIAESQTYSNSLNNSLISSVYSDNNYLGQYADLTLIPLNLTGGSHNLTILPTKNIIDGLYTPEYSAISTYTYTISEGGPFLVNVQSFSLSDTYVQTYITATKDGDYTVYENGTEIGNGNFVFTGTSIQSVRETELGVLVFYALKFVNSTDTLWFNTTYSNADLITPPTGQPPVFIGVWYERESIHITDSDSNTYDFRSYYTYVSEFIIKHILWVIPTNNLDWLEFSLPMHWSNVSLNIIETTLGASTNNNYNYTTIYAGADYVLTAYSGEGYGYDYKRQKQILAIEDTTSDYMVDGSFENGVWTDDWYNAPNGFEDLSITSDIVSDGEFALKLNSTDANTDYLEFSNLDPGDYYISFDYYVVATDSLVYLQTSIDDVNVIFDTSTEKNKWHSYYHYFSFDDTLYDWIRFDSSLWQGEFIVDNIQIWEASGQVETIENQQYYFSASFLTWDNYQNIYLPNIDVEGSLREGSTNEEIISQTLTTNEFGIASYTFKGTLDNREYVFRWHSSDSWFDNGFIDNKIDFTEDEGFSGGINENFNGVDTYKITTIASTTVSMGKTLSTLKTYDDNLLFSFRVYSEFTGSSWQIRNILYDIDGHIYFDIGNLVTLNQFTTLTYELSDYTVTSGDPDKLNSFSFGHYAYSSDLYVYWDYIKFIMPQKTYFTPLSAGYIPYSYETKTDGSKNYFDFSEGTLDGLNWRIPGSIFNTTITNGYANFDTITQWRGIDTDTPLSTSIDTNYYDQAIIRFKGNITDTSMYFHYTVDTVTYYPTHLNTTADVWQIYTVDLVAGEMTYFAFQTRYTPNAMTNIQVDYIQLIHKTYDSGRSWEFDTDLQGWDYGFLGSPLDIREWRDGAMYMETDGSVVRGTNQDPNSYSSNILAGQTISVKITLSATTNVRLYLYRPDTAWNAVWFNDLSVGVNYINYILAWDVNGLGILLDAIPVNAYVDYVRILDNTSNPPLETDSYFQISTNSNEQYAAWLDDVYLGINIATAIILKNNTVGSHTFEYALYKDISNDYSPQLAALIQRHSYTVIDNGDMYIRLQDGVGQYIPFESFTSYYRFNSDPYSAMGDNIISFSEITSTVDIFINDTFGNTVANEIGVAYSNFHIIIVDAHEVFFSNQVAQSLLIQLKIPSASWSESVGYWIGLDSFRAITLYNGTYDYRVLASDGATILLVSTPIDVDDDMAIELTEESDLGIYSYTWGVGTYNTTLTVVTNHGDAIIRVWDESGYIGEWTETDNIIWAIPTGLDQSVVTFYVMKEVQKYGVLVNQTLVRTYTYPIGIDHRLLQTDVAFYELNADTFRLEASSNHDNTTISIDHDGINEYTGILGVYGAFNIVKITTGGFHNVTVVLEWINSTGSTFTNTYIFDYWINNYYAATYEIIPRSPGLKIASNEIDMTSFNIYVDDELITPILPDELREQSTENINMTVIYDGYLFIRSSVYNHSLVIKDKWDFLLYETYTDMRNLEHKIIELPLVRVTFISEREGDVELQMYFWNSTSKAYELASTLGIGAGEIVDGVWVIAGQYAIRVWDITTGTSLINDQRTSVQVFSEDTSFRDAIPFLMEEGYSIFKMTKTSVIATTEEIGTLLERFNAWSIQFWNDYKWWIIGLVSATIVGFVLFGNLLKGISKKKKKPKSFESTTKLPTVTQRRSGKGPLPQYSRNPSIRKPSLPTVSARKNRKLPNNK